MAKVVITQTTPHHSSWTQ